jgi:uncharacterized protein (TIGR01777 family)
MSKIMILGGSGFIGSHLIQHLSGQSLVIVSRHQVKTIAANQQWLTWHELEADPNILKQCSHIISLCGQSLLGLWSKNYKNKLVQSRTEPLEKIASLLDQVQHSPYFIIASGVGYYGWQKSTTTLLTESSKVQQPNFLTHIAHKTENCLPIKYAKNAAYLRLGVVLEPSGGVLRTLKLPTQIFGGCIWGNGTQPMSWISMHDAVHCISFLIKQHETGAFNLCAPQPTTHQEFTRSYASFLHRPCWIRIPTWVCKQSGEMMRNTILQGQAAYPKQLLDLGYQFKHQTLKSYFSSRQPC